ncbi:MAG: hypothetical protein GY953_33085 [bacterium]|nr:hypothetical protein [bacterium]
MDAITLRVQRGTFWVPLVRSCAGFDYGSLEQIFAAPFVVRLYIHLLAGLQADGNGCELKNRF